jgi:hypothetical protein
LRHARGLVAKRMDECLTGCAVGEGIDHIGVGDVGELIALLREALNVLPKGLIAALPAITLVPRVSRLGVRTLEVVDEDGAEIAPTADATGLELLEPISCRTRQK